MFLKFIRQTLKGILIRNGSLTGCYYHKEVVFGYL